MKRIVAAASLALLAGCASHEYGSWLDTLGKPGPTVAISDAEASGLLQQVRELKLREDSLRVQVALEPDRVKRFQMYAQLRALADERVPLERRLREAGRTPRPLLVGPAA